MICLQILFFWILMNLTKVEMVTYRGTLPCGKNITNAGGLLTFPISLDPCTWRYIRPNGEKIFLSAVNSYFCCYDIVVYNGKIDTKSIIFNGSMTAVNNSMPSIIHINVSTAIITFRMHYLLEARRLMLWYYSTATPDNKGNRFVFPRGSSVIVSTYKSQNVTVKDYCKISPYEFDLVVSIDNTVVKYVHYPWSKRSIPYRLYGGASLQADDDIVVYYNHRGSIIPTALMPLDVSGTQYIIALPNISYLIIVMGIGKDITVNLTFPECPGNCSLPDCATKDVSFKLTNNFECNSLIYLCSVDITGSMLTSDFPVSVMVESSFQTLQLPPVNTWGRKFIVPSLPYRFLRTFNLKIVSKEADTNVTLLCFRPNAKIETYNLNLNQSGDHVVHSISTARNCWITSNKPVLPVCIMKGEEEVVFIIPPVEQYSYEYLLPAELCRHYDRFNKSLIIISATKYIDGLRINGLPIAVDIVQRQQIGKTGYTSLFVNLGAPKLHLLDHTEPNIVFGVYLICSKQTENYVIPLGTRMAPIAEKCEFTSSIPGDGLDNDCDDRIDEDICDKSSTDNFHNETDCAVTYREIIPCLKYTDTNEVEWKTTMPNDYDYQTCGKRMTGNTSNLCELKVGRYGVWRGPDTSFCVSESVSAIAAKLHLTLNGTINVTLADILNETLSITYKLISKENFNAGNLKSVIESLDLAVTIIEERSTLGTTKRERENFISVLDRLLSSVNVESWRMLNQKIKTTNYVSTIMSIVSRFGFQVHVNQLEDIILVRENIVFESKQGFIDDVIFPNVTVLSSTYQQMTDSVNAMLFLSKDTIKNNLNGSIDFTAVYYRTLAKLLPSTFGLSVGSDIVSFSLPAFTAANNLFPPVQIEYEYVYSNKTNSTCVFWDFEKGIDGDWSTDGCYAEYRNSSYTSCRCNHFTNFAVLLSAFKFTEDDTTALTIITWPGLVTSILCLLITIFLHIYFWRNVSSDKSKILICLCAVLVLAYIILLAGLNLTDNASMCSAIAIVLHYLFLCALCLMVAEGIDIAMSILIVFSQGRSNAGLLLSFGLVFPFVIVVISMAATQFKGYGTEQYCWLSVSNGLIYAFLVPCIIAVLTNIIISILVLRKMFSTKAMMNKDAKEKIRAGVRSIAVLAPILGLTWLFGILSSHKDLIVFAYLFTIFNSFQGLLIFIFHCLMNPKIQQAVKRKYDRFVLDHPWAKIKMKEKMDVSTVDTDVSKTTKPTTGTDSTGV